MACGGCPEGEKHLLKETDVVVGIPASALKPGVFTDEILKKASLFNSLTAGNTGPIPMLEPTPPVISLPHEVDKKLPSYKEMAFGVTESLKTSLMQLARGGAVFSDKETTEKRMNECLNCEFLIPAQSRCSKCGCFMNMKTRLQTSTCPIGKW